MMNRVAVLVVALLNSERPSKAIAKHPGQATIITGDGRGDFVQHYRS